jgi:hypothetical protein
MSQGFTWYRFAKAEATTVAFSNGEAIGIYIATTGTCVITLPDGVTTVDLGSPPTGTIIPIRCTKFAGTAVVVSLY